MKFGFSMLATKRFFKILFKYIMWTKSSVMMAGPQPREDRRDGEAATSQGRAEKAEGSARSEGPQPLEGGSLGQGSLGGQECF